MTSPDERAQEMHEQNSAEREGTIRALEETMMDWVEGRKSHWNYYAEATIGVHGQRDSANASVLCSIADTAEVVKFSAAIQALRAGQ